MDKMSQELICRKCGRTKEEHCIFEPIEIPEGCQCNFRDWGDPTCIPKVCDRISMYVRDDEDGICSACEHEWKCHRDDKGS